MTRTFLAHGRMISLVLKDLSNAFDNKPRGQWQDEFRSCTGDSSCQRRWNHRYDPRKPSVPDKILVCYSIGIGALQAVNPCVMHLVYRVFGEFVTSIFPYFAKVHFLCLVISRDFLNWLLLNGTVILLGSKKKER